MFIFWCILCQFIWENSWYLLYSLNFYSIFYSIEEQYHRLSGLRNNRKGNKKPLFSTLKNKSLSKSKNISLDGKQILYPIKGFFKMCDYNPNCFCVTWLDYWCHHNGLILEQSKKEVIKYNKNMLTKIE